MFMYNYLIFNFTNFKFKMLNIVLKSMNENFRYFLISEIIWQEGFLIDFLQKKIADNWIRKFLINSAYLFNERLIFDKIIRFYLDLIIWPMHKFFITEFNSVANILITLVLMFVVIFFIIFIFFIFLISF